MKPNVTSNSNSTSARQGSSKGKTNSPAAPHASHLATHYNPAAGRLTVIRRGISVRGGARLIVQENQQCRAAMRIRFEASGGTLAISLRMQRPGGGARLFKVEAYQCTGTLADDPVLGIRREGQQCTLNLVEAIVARCYALLRDEAAALDRARGYAALRANSEALARQWRDGSTGTFTLSAR